MEEWLDKTICGPEQRDFSNWIPVQTNLLISNSAPVVIPATNTHRYFRAQWLP